MSLSAEIVAVGSELLRPGRAETNGSYLAGRLGESGIAVRFRSVVGDARGDIAAVLGAALARAEVVIATGGLGPTVDDLTREAVADLLNVPLEEDPALARMLEERYRARGLSMPPQTVRQAQVPRGAEVLPNTLGSAPGLLLRPRAGRMLVLLPGVPSEMRRMFDESAAPRLPNTGERFAYRVLKIAGLTESEVDHRLDPVARRASPVEWTILAAPGQVEIHLCERVQAGGGSPGIERIDGEIASILGGHLFGRDAETLEGLAGRLLRERRETVATAESVTGGMIAGRLSAVPGASDYLVGGIVSYTADAKVAVARVPAGLIERHGAVSVEVATAMAEGARAVFAATWGLAATGYAGPEGGPEGPPGTVFVALAGPSMRRNGLVRLPGDREAVRLRAVRSALDLLRRALGDGPGS